MLGMGLALISWGRVPGNIWCLGMEAEATQGVPGAELGMSQAHLGLGDSSRLPRKRQMA